MNEEFGNIKAVYEDVLEHAANSDGFKFNNDLSKKDYIRKTYSEISKNNYGGLRNDALSLMDISRTPFDNLMLDCIYTNLYLDLTVIIQLLEVKGLRREYFLAETDAVDNNKNTVERIRKRMQESRLSALTQIKIENESGNKYYVPNIMRAYREILFVKRAGTQISDISNAFFDIFSALFYDTDEQSKDKIFTSGRDIVKSYRIWDISENTIAFIDNIYKGILNGSKRSDIKAEIILFEKLFAFFNASNLLMKKTDEKKTLILAEALSRLVKLSFSELHKLIINKINIKNYDDYETIINEYIYPVCTETLSELTREIIRYLGRLESSSRTNFAEDFRNLCANNMNSNLSYEDISIINDTPPDTVVRLVKKLLDAPLDNNALGNYITYAGHFSDDYYSDKYEFEKTFIFDRRLTDLTYIKNEKMSYCTDDSSIDNLEEFLNNNKRIIY